eukprot:jgi/Mesvir1/14805/Mv05444-RA.1
MDMPPGYSEDNSFAATPHAIAPAIGVGRVVAIGDLHGDLHNTLGSLQLAGLINSTHQWVGGSATLVQTGDIVDRGNSSLEIYQLFQRLAVEAQAVGGRIIHLMGNHEVMNLLNDLRYVSRVELTKVGLAAVKEAGNQVDVEISSLTSSQRQRLIQLGLARWRALFSATGRLGRWIRANFKVAAVEGRGKCRTLFVHAGLVPEFAQLGLAALQQEMMDTIAGTTGGMRTPLILGEMGPVWVREFALGHKKDVCAMLRTTLDMFNATRMVVGHTVQHGGRFTQRCDGQLVLIDVGISSAYVGTQAAWECHNDRAKELYPPSNGDPVGWSAQ